MSDTIDFLGSGAPAAPSGGAIPLGDSKPEPIPHVAPKTHTFVDPNEQFAKARTAWETRYDAIIKHASDTYGVAQPILKAVLGVETTGDPKANSGVAIGLGQFTRDTAKQYGLIGPDGTDHRTDPALSIMASAHYLSDLIKRYGNNRDGIIKAVAAYDEGPGAMDKGGPNSNAETADYWRKVLNIASYYGYEPGKKPMSPAATTAHVENAIKTAGISPIEPNMFQKAGQFLTMFAQKSGQSIQQGVGLALHGGKGPGGVDIPPAWLNLLPGIGTSLYVGQMLSSVITRPGQALRSAIAGGGAKGAVEALGGKQAPGQDDVNSDKVWNAIAHRTGLPDTDHSGWGRYVERFGTQVLVDPTVAAGLIGKVLSVAADSGRLGKFGEAIGAVAKAPERAENAIVGSTFRGLSQGRGATQVGAATATGLSKASWEVADKTLAAVQSVAKGLHAAFSENGRVIQALSEKYGADWVDKYSQTYSLYHGLNSTRDIHSAIMEDQLFNNVFSGLDEQAKRTILRAVDNGKISGLAPELQAKAKTLQEVTRTLAYMEGDEALHTHLTQELGYVVPAWARNMVGDISKTPRGIMDKGTFRDNYITYPSAKNVPNEWGHGMTERGIIEDAWESVTGQRRAYDQIKEIDPYLQRRDSKNMNFGKFGADDYIMALQRRIKAGQAMTIGWDGTKALREMYDHNIPTEVMRWFNPAQFRETLMKSGEIADFPEKAVSMVKGDRAFQTMIAATDLGRAGLFAMPFPHMANITNLAFLVNPLTIIDTFKHYGDMQKLTAAGRLDKYAEEVKYGIIGAPQNLAHDYQTLADMEQSERGSAFMASIDTPAVLLRKGEKYMKGVKADGTLSQFGAKAVSFTAASAAQSFENLGKLYRWSTSALWNYDDAAKVALFRHFKDVYGDPSRAAYETMNALINYASRSPVAELTRPLFNFTTWRTKVPIAMTRAMVRHPQLFIASHYGNQAAGNIAGSALGGQPMRQTGPEGVFNEEADATRSMYGATDLVRRTATPAVRSGLSGIVRPPGFEGQEPYMTYGEDPMASMLWGYNPMAAPLSLVGQNPLQKSVGQRQTFFDWAINKAGGNDTEKAMLHSMAGAATGLIEQSIRESPDYGSQRLKEISNDINTGNSTFQAIKDYRQQHKRSGGRM